MNNIILEGSFHYKKNRNWKIEFRYKWEQNSHCYRSKDCNCIIPKSKRMEKCYTTFEQKWRGKT